jgi:hypothetical protein
LAHGPFLFVPFPFPNEAQPQAQPACQQRQPPTHPNPVVVLRRCPTQRLPSTIDYRFRATAALLCGLVLESSPCWTPFLTHRIGGENNEENQEENLSEFIPNRESRSNPNKIKFLIESNELEIKSGSCSRTLIENPYKIVAPGRIFGLKPISKPVVALPDIFSC